MPGYSFTIFRSAPVVCEVYVRACVCAVGALASSSCCRPSIGVHMFVCVCSRALMHQLLSVNGVFLGAARRFPDIPCSMSRDGFTQCPYCDLWVPHVFQMTHLATHGGDMEALLGKPAGSSPAVAGGAAVAPRVDVRLGTPGSVAAAAPFVPTVAASVAGGAVASAPEAPRAETCRWERIGGDTEYTRVYTQHVRVRAGSWPCTYVRMARVRGAHPSRAELSSVAQDREQ
jgi:hypothetical protein